MELHALYDRLDFLRWKFKAAEYASEKNYYQELIQELEKQIQDLSDRF